MEILGLVGFAGVVVFGLLYIVFFLKGASLKIPVIGMAAFVLVLAAAVLLSLMGITLPGSSTAGEPSESTAAGGEPSGPTPALTSAPAPTPTPGPASTPASTPEPEPTPTSTPTPTSAPTPAPAEDFKRVLTGGWSNARREGDMIYTLSYSFSVGGTIEVTTGAYINIHNWEDDGYDWGEDEYGWFIAPMGHPSFYGNYSLTAMGGGRFALKEVGEWTDAGPLTSTEELTYVDDNTIRIDGATYVRGSNYTLAELARIFGFDIEF